MLETVLLWSLLVLSVLGTAEAADRPNIVIIVADDLGWNDVGFHGSDQIPTPNLDRLAREGIILNNYYVQQVCTPTRGALMTGRYPIHTGLQHSVIHPPEPWGLGLDEKLLPEYLNELGYVSRMVGKWHLGFYAADYTPTRRGFLSHYGYWTGHEDYWDHTNGDPESATGFGLDFRRNMTADLESFGQYSTEAFTNESVKIIDGHDQSKPLFLYLAHQAVHAGNPDRWLEAPYKYFQNLINIRDPYRRQFAAMTVALDVSVGHVVSALQRNRMLDDTVIVFTSDNGGPAHHYQQNMANNWPLRGVKNTLWEGGLRAAAFVWSPLLRPRVSHQLMHVTDWLPTLLSAAGAKNDIFKNRNLDGINQWPMLLDDTPSERYEILHNIDEGGKIFALRVGDFKLISPDWRTSHWFGWYPPAEYYEDLKFEPTESEVNDIEFPDMDISWMNTNIIEIGDLKIRSIIDVASKKYRSSIKDSAQVKCGPIPPNAATNCKPGTACLYHITSDPCEFHNIYDQEPRVVRIMYSRLAQYNSGAVPPRNKDPDVKANPKFFNNTWSPWVQLDSEGRETYIIEDFESNVLQVT